MIEREEGYKDRESLIRDHWKRYGGAWDVKRIGPRFKMPIRHELYPYFASEAESIADQKPVVNTLEFSFERGTLDGQPAYRVICDGIIVEQGLL